MLISSKKEKISSSGAWGTDESEEEGDNSDRERLEKAGTINYLSQRFSMRSCQAT